MKQSAIILALVLVVSTWSITAQDQGGPPPSGERPPGHEAGPGGPDSPGGTGGQGGFRLLPLRAEEQLNLTAEQQKQLAGLAAETKAKLEKILTPDQLQQVKQMGPPDRLGGREGGLGGGFGGGDPFAQGGPGGGMGGPGGRGGFRLVPPLVLEQLNLTSDQQKQLTSLEAEMKAKLDKILTPAQMQQLQRMRGPQGQGGRGGGPGGMGGPGGRGGSGGGQDGPGGRGGSGGEGLPQRPPSE